MSSSTDSRAAGFRLIQIVGFVVIFVFLIAYLFVSYVLGLEDPYRTFAGNEMAFYILLTLAFLFPAWYFVLEKLTIIMLRRESMETRKRQRGWITVSIGRFAAIAACLVFGLGAVATTGETDRFWIFLAIAAVWATVWWPTAARIKTIIEKVEAP